MGGPRVGGDQEGPDINSVYDRLNMGADLLFDNFQLLVAPVGDIALGDNGGVDLIKMRDHPAKGDATPSTNALGNSALQTVR